jgi:predicted metal-dependent enzyme (double-stranded beta helix superfamily)
MRPSFDLERFVADCRDAADDAARVREIVARAVSEPAALLRSLGVPQRAALKTLYRATDLTILDARWAPGMSVLPHDHRTWAVIGVYAGREDNRFWRRTAHGPLQVAGVTTLEEREVAWLDRQVVHAVRNPLSQFTAAIHVYGGDFFAIERSEWDGEARIERRFSIERAMQQFDDANASGSHS